ncbi:MAG: hypothetical protein ACTHVE_10405 [Senegalia sp. (in: firmicutes)]
MNNNKIINKKEDKKIKNKVDTKAMRNILDASLDEIEINEEKKED